MSESKVIISAVHELSNEQPSDFWNDENVNDVLDVSQKIDDDEKYVSGEYFESESANETFEVQTVYHSNRSSYVVEIILDGDEGIADISMTGLEDIIEEINDKFERNFTLEAYYWYTGTSWLGQPSRP